MVFAKDCLNEAILDAFGFFEAWRLLQNGSVAYGNGLTKSDNGPKGIAVKTGSTVHLDCCNTSNNAHTAVILEGAGTTGSMTSTKIRGGKFGVTLSDTGRASLKGCNCSIASYIV